MKAKFLHKASDYTPGDPAMFTIAVYNVAYEGLDARTIYPPLFRTVVSCRNVKELKAEVDKVVAQYARHDAHVVVGAATGQYDGPDGFPKMRGLQQYLDASWADGKGYRALHKTASLDSSS